MTEYGQRSSDRLDPSGKAAMASVATPQSPGSSASSPPQVPGSSTAGAALPPETAQPAIPDHDLLRCIGRGSYGEVWLARDVLGQYRAVKVIRRAHFESDHTYEREFEGLKRYEPVSRGDPSQVAVLHVGRQDDAGFYYYVMELADGVETPKAEARDPKEIRRPKREPTAAKGEACAPDFYTPRTLKSDLARRKRLPLRSALRLVWRSLRRWTICMATG